MDSKDPPPAHAKSIYTPPPSGILHQTITTIRMKHLSLEHHLRRLVRKLLRKPQSRFVQPSLKGCVLRTLKTYPPSEQILLIQSHRNRQVRFASLSHYIHSYIHSNCFFMCNIANLRSPPCIYYYTPKPLLEYIR